MAVLCFIERPGPHSRPCLRVAMEVPRTQLPTSSSITSAHIISPDSKDPRSAHLNTTSLENSRS